MKKLIIVLALILLPKLVFAQTYIVESVVSGDTLKLSNGEEVRLIGIDCPEEDTKEGPEATEYVKRWVEGKEVYLEYDAEKRDKYGRLLAYVYIDEGIKRWSIKRKIAVYHYETKGLTQYVFLNASLVKAGYASPMTIFPNVKYIDLFRKLYEEARESKRGRWR